MTRLIQALRRNPDAMALAVLCIVLGAGRQTLAARPMSSLSRTAMGLHWVCAKPATDAIDGFRDKLRHLGCRAFESLQLPDLNR